MHITRNHGVKCSLALACMFVVSGGSLVGCSSTSHATDRSPITSNHSLVMPTMDLRLTQVSSGLAEPGSDFGPYSNRQDARMGVASSPSERLSYGYERLIYDRQFSSSGRPFNTYMDTTRTRTRVGR